ncbi:MAG: prephenate dehydrogenase [Acidobacteriota bacterium]|nr:prephenate dehydrogenase [Acidobacteriota bacterium]
MNTIAIYGVGLIGGSFALALRKGGFAGRILGVSSPGTLTRALENRIIDEAASPESAAQQADVLYLAQPVRAILDSLPELNKWVRPDALITDAGSTKQAIVAQAAESLMGAQFLGGHPLAGKESRGLPSADADLFRGRTYVLTPASADALATPRAREFLSWLERIGAVPTIMDAEEHDRTVALTSHLPQLGSVALAMLLAQKNCVDQGAFGPGLLDSTRLALSPYEVWADILATNSGFIDQALTAFIAVLETLRHDLTKPEMSAHFGTAALLANRVRSTKPNPSGF